MHNADVVAQQFAQRLVLHRRVRLAPHRVAELPLNHGERRLHVAALVVRLQELSRLYTSRGQE